MKKTEKPFQEKDLVDLAQGKRDPQTDKEKELQQQIEEIKKKGRIVEIPKDFI